MEFQLDASFHTPLTARERNLLIRYCVSVATRGTCATKSLLRPLNQKDLKSAFDEQLGEHLARIEAYTRQAEAYDPETSELSQAMLSVFGGVPTKAQFGRYCRAIVKQEKETIRMRKRMYGVSVNYASVNKTWLAFHRSLSPRVTFGYSSMLHEACDFAFDEETRAAFLSALATPPLYKGDVSHDWGNVMLGAMQLFYEDLALYRGETRILETVSHEEMLTVRLEEGDLAALAAARGAKALARKLGELKTA